jgi:alkylation response protein AidB-like acyl-CoA dehydrogenase
MIIIHVYMATLERGMTAVAEAGVLRQLLREYLDGNAPVTAALTDSGRTAGFVRAFQPSALLVPEEFGGAGGSLTDAVTVAAESGRALLGGQVLGDLLAAALLRWAPPSARRADLLTRLAEGSASVAAPVWTSPECPGFTGTVLTAFPATHALVFSAADGGLSLLCAELTPEAVTAQGGMDPTRPLGCLNPDALDPSALGPGVRDGAAAIARGRDAEELLRRYLALARTALAAEQAAGARRCVEMTVAYAHQRIQFGVPIATFQAVKHTCASMHIDTAEAEALAALATSAVGSDSDSTAGDASTSGNGGRTARLADQAKALAAEAFIAVARSAIEVHGGVGFAWEHPVQLFYKRALASAAYFGRPAARYAALAARDTPAEKTLS